MFKDKDLLDQLNFTTSNAATLKSLIEQSFILLSWAKKDPVKLYDYSFVVMPAAKALEGFLKDWLVGLGLVPKEVVASERFRLGKALNPELEHVPYLKRECLYDEISQKCGENLAQILWETWKKCRNRVFHFFPNEQQVFTLEEAEGRLNQIAATINLCQKS